MSDNSLNGYRRHAGAPVVENRVGLLVVFGDGTTKEQVQKIADSLVKQDLVDPRSPPHIDEFNPNHGYPVFYIP